MTLFTQIIEFLALTATLASCVELVKPQEVLTGGGMPSVSAKKQEGENVLQSFVENGGSDAPFVDVSNAIISQGAVKDHKSGFVHQRASQYYAKLRVFGTSLARHMGPGRGAAHASGQLVLGIGDDLPVDVNLSAANHSAKLESVMRQRTDAAKHPGNVFIYGQHSETVIYLHHKKACVAFFINFVIIESDIDGKGSIERPYYIFDVATDKLLAQWDGLENIVEKVGTGPGGNPNTGYVYYGSEASKFWVRYTSETPGSICAMDSENVRVINMNHTNQPSDELVDAYAYNCFYHAGDAINGAKSPLNDAMFYGTLVHDMFMQWYTVTPWDGPIVIRVHFHVDVAQAFWDGQTVAFGDGNDKKYPMVVLDILAHEVAHGFTSFHSGLIYSGQSGGMNEAFSDMAGIAANLFHTGNIPEDFHFGRNVLKMAGAMRYMDYPPGDGQSIEHVDNYADGMDVHYSSGIYNKAFYLMATAAGWTSREAFDVMLCANKYYWIADENFEAGALGVQNCALELGYSQQAVIDAFAAVGIPLQPLEEIDLPTELPGSLPNCEEGYFWC